MAPKTASKRHKPAAKAPEIPEEIPEPPKVGVLVPQPHGGALMRGGTNPGAGRPRDIVRAACLKSFRDRIPILEAIADGQVMEKTKVMGVGGPEGVQEYDAEVSAKPGDRIKAIAELGKVGFGADAPSIVAAGSVDAGGTRFTLVIGERAGSDE